MLGFEVAVGDEVAFGRLSQNRVRFARVAKINRWGHIILDNGLNFDKHGNQRDTVFTTSAHYLIEIGKARAFVEHRQIQNERNAAARNIIHTLEQRKNGYGDFCEIDDATRQRLLDLVAKL
jgi:hypothetical protein